MEESLSDHFENRLKEISKNTILDPAIRKKKLILWFIRSILTIIMYIIFWDYSWVRWSLLVTVPLNLFSLFSILGSTFLLKRKIERTKQKIENATIQNK